MPSRKPDLVSRARKGDSEALHELFSQHTPMLTARLRGRLPAHLGRKMSAADLVQDTLLVATERLPEFEDRGEGSFARWLTRIADLRLKDQLRRFGRHRRALNRELTRGQRPDTAAAEANNPSPSQEAMIAERRDLVRGTLDRLPVHYREILLLVQEERLPLREAAVRIGKNYEATKKLYGRALGAFSEGYDG